MLLCRAASCLALLAACSTTPKMAPIPNVPLWDYSLESSFRANTTNPVLDRFTDLSLNENIDRPLIRRVGLYRYRLNSTPFGMYITGPADASWVSVQDPPVSAIVLDQFQPPIRAIGVNTFSFVGANKAEKATVGLVIYTKHGRVIREAFPANEQTFVGVVSPSDPILAVRVQIFRPTVGARGRTEYPALRGVMLGSATFVK